MTSSEFIQSLWAKWEHLALIAVILGNGDVYPLTCSDDFVSTNCSRDLLTATSPMTTQTRMNNSFGMHGTRHADIARKLCP